MKGFLDIYRKNGQSLRGEWVWEQTSLNKMPGFFQRKSHVS